MEWLCQILPALSLRRKGEESEVSFDFCILQIRSSACVVLNFSIVLFHHHDLTCCTTFSGHLSFYHSNLLITKVMQLVLRLMGFLSIIIDLFVIFASVIQLTASHRKSVKIRTSEISLEKEAAAERASKAARPPGPRRERGGEGGGWCRC